MQINQPIAVLFFLVFISMTAQNPPNYINYHKEINRAEILFFMEEKVDSSLTLYDEVFENYDFIFVKDLVNAAQIAHFKDKPYKKYLKRGFEFGLKIGHLKNYPLFDDVFQKLKDSKELQKAYTINRKKYIESIDYDYLDWMYELFLKDQMDKRKDNYRSIVQETLRKLRDKISQKGFPGDKIIGISDSTIFAEVGKPKLDLKPRSKEYGKTLWYVETSDDILSAYEAYVPLVHYACPYQKLKNLLWEEMKKGNIHPRDIGMLYDNVFRYTDNPSTMPDYCDWPSYVYFRLNAFGYYPKETKENIAETNALRKSFYIVPLAVDERKKEYEKKYGFNLVYGFFECR